MATTRYYYIGTQTKYNLTNITKENHPSPSNLSFTGSYTGHNSVVPFCYSTILYTLGSPVVWPGDSSSLSDLYGYFLSSGPGAIGYTIPGFETSLSRVTIPAGNYIYLPSYVTYRADDWSGQYYYTDSYGSQDYWVIPSPSDSYSTIHSKLTGCLMGENVDGYSVYGGDEMLVYYCATDVVFSGYLDGGGAALDSSTRGYISYVSGTLQLVKGDVVEEITNIYTVKTSNSYDYIYGGYAQGSYSLEPSSVAITTTSLQAGKSATISVTRSSSTGSNASTYGFPITYKYQYSTNGGTSWTDIVSSTATTYNFTVPSNATSIMVRVIPSDSLGTGSAVASTNYTVQKPPSNYAGVSGTVKTVVPKVCVGGTIKTNVTVKKGVNGTVK